MFKIISELKRSDPERRAVVLNRMHDKNIAYFRQQNPLLADFLETAGTGRFEIRVSNKSLDVLDRINGQPCHPPGELFSYMEEFGSSHHSGWVDKLSIHHVWRGEYEHSKLAKDFLEEIYADLPTLSNRLAQNGAVALPTLADGRRYSGAVVFLGIFTGLHIMNYLSRTVVRDFFMIEPDPDRFALSTYFLDYRFLEEHFGGLLLHVGPDMPQHPVDLLTNRSRITSAVWVRLLPAYPDGRFDEVIDRVSLRWRGLTEIFVPFDREVKNLQYGARNIIAKRPFLHHPPKLSSKAAVAIVASGPSLNQDLGWLRENQSRLIIVASISSVRVLKENGIRIDFQCTLDTELEEPLLDQLQLDYDIPLVAYYKLDPEVCKRFSRINLLSETYKANVVRFLSTLDNTHPTTGNLMTAFVAWCKPAQLFLFGLDFGYRDPKQSHVKGGLHDDNDGAENEREMGGREHFPVAGNFEEGQGEMLTMAYYNSARHGVEAVLMGLNQNGCVVYNCSDGAKITGAEPIRSKSLVLPKYPKKDKDIAAIVAGFDTDYANIWEAYDVTGATLIDEMKDDILGALSVEKGFNWPAWSAALDGAMDVALSACETRHREFRLEVYSKFMHDLLSEWYRAMLLCESRKEEAIVYQSGLKALQHVLDRLQWPKDLQDFERR